MARKFYKNRIEIIVLTEDAPISGNTDISDIIYDMNDGDSSGEVIRHAPEEVDGPTMAKLLQEQGSDPEFFQLDAEGVDLSEGTTS